MVGLADLLVGNCRLLVVIGLYSNCGFVSGRSLVMDWVVIGLGFGLLSLGGFDRCGVGTWEGCTDVVLTVGFFLFVM